MNRRAVALVVSMGCSACGRLGFADYVGGGPATQSVLALDRAAPGEPLLDFPLLVVLDATRADLAAMLPDANDLRFAASDGTPLPYELEQVGPPVIAWVRVPTITDTTTTIVASYGDPSAPRAAGHVWSDAYEGVWHLAGSTIVDSTTHARDGVASGTSEAAGRVGGARAFVEATTDYIVVPDGTVALPAFTLSGWIEFADVGLGGYSVILTREYGDSGDDDFFLGATTVAYAALTTTDMSISNYASTALPKNTWLHLATVWNGTSNELYVDAALVGTQPSTGTLMSTPGPLYLGCDRNNLSGTQPSGIPDINFFDGELDEIRFEHVARSASWLAYDHAAQLDQIITYGPITTP